MGSGLGTRQELLYHSGPDEPAGRERSGVRTMKTIWMALCCLLVCLDARAATYQDIIRKWQSGAPIRAVIIGNSISQGYYAKGWEKIRETPSGDPRGRGKLTAESWADDGIDGVATQLRRLLRSKNPASTLANESADGWDSNMVLGLTAKINGEPPVDTIASIIAASPAYDVAFVPLQINDLTHGLALESFQANQRAIVQRLKDAGIVPVLVKENATDKAEWFPQWVRFMAEVDNIAAEKSVAVIDGYTPFIAAVTAGGGFTKAPVMYDYIHPNQAGHDILFSAYAAWFNQRLPSTTKGEKL
jgi:hypothetical protein